MADLPARGAASLTLAWIAHAYTALGAATALAATLDVFAGDFRGAFTWLGLAIVIDATDGALARALHVKERLPGYDGARLDDIVDYLTYVFVPALLVVRAGLVPASIGPVVAVAMLLASAYGFGRVDAKVAAPDFAFTGFPSYWNVVAFYLYVFRLPGAWAAAILLSLAVLVFVPVRCVYPSRTRWLRTTTLTLGTLWGALLFVLLWRLPATDGPWAMLSLGFPAYYTVLSVRLTTRARG